MRPARWKGAAPPFALSGAGRKRRRRCARRFGRRSFSVEPRMSSSYRALLQSLDETDDVARGLGRRIKPGRPRSCCARCCASPVTKWLCIAICLVVGLAMSVVIPLIIALPQESQWHFQSWFHSYFSSNSSQVFSVIFWHFFKIRALIVLRKRCSVKKRCFIDTYQRQLLPAASCQQKWNGLHVCSTIV